MDKKVKAPNPNKAYIFIIIIAIASSFYLGSNYISTIFNKLDEIKDNQLNAEILLKIISRKIDIDEKVQQKNLKIATNRRVFENTDCANCHNRPALALPIHKITLAGAMDIVRNGTEASKKGGMPQYSKSSKRDSRSITDADLKVRLESLYIKQFLDLTQENEEILINE